MKRIIKNTLTLFALAAAMVACEDAQPVVDTAVKDTVVSVRETLVNAEAYAHGDVYNTGDVSYKVTLALASDGVKALYDPTKNAYTETFDVYAGTGYMFEFELNSAAADSIVPGVYVADPVLANGKSAKAAGTFNVKNSYLILCNGVASGGKYIQMPLDPDIKLTVTLSGSEYTVAIDGKNTAGVSVKGTYVGNIEVKDITYYREPTTPKTFNITAESVVYEPGADNEDLFWWSIDPEVYGVGLTEHNFTVTGSNGEILILYIQDAALEPIHISKLSSGVYEFGYAEYSMETSGVYNTTKNYRKDGTLYAPYLSVNGDIFYLTGEVELTMDKFGTKVETLQITEAYSAYGSTVSVTYAPAQE